MQRFQTVSVDVRHNERARVGRQYQASVVVAAEGERQRRAARPTRTGSIRSKTRWMSVQMRGDDSETSRQRLQTTEMRTMSAIESKSGADSSRKMVPRNSGGTLLMGALSVSAVGSA